MRCRSCGFENPQGMRFCGNCARPLDAVAACPRCGFANPRAFKYCGECGAALGTAADATPARDPRSYTPRHLAEKILTSRSALEGERKQVSVLFADIQGSMELAERVDAEEWHRVLDRFFQILTEGVHRFEGTVNQYTGDGIMALFGAPIAHEDHAQRACYAALWLRDELREYAGDLRRTRGLNFSVRMGINSGEVVVGRIGDDLRMDYTAQGATVGIAQRIEQLASPGSAYLTEETARLVRGYFELRDLGPFELLRSREPVRVYELASIGTARTRLERAEVRGLTRFVGRRAELAVLETALAGARAGQGAVVALVGAPGLGKSRLCREFAERCLGEGLAVHRAHCSPHGRSVSFAPLRELLRNVFGLGENDAEVVARKKIAGTLVLLGDAATDALPFLFDFLGVRDPENPPPELDALGRKRELFGFVERLLRATGTRAGASVLLFDDLQWMDAASDEVLAHMVHASRDTHTLLVCNGRPEYAAGWLQEPHVRILPLEPLESAEVAEMLDDLLGADSSLAALRGRLEERAAGNPFFLEELVQSLVESEAFLGARGSYRLAREIGELEIPATIQPILAARIDRLAEREKRLVQVASVVGKRFEERLLREATGSAEPEFAAALIALQDAEMLHVEALFPQVEYAFRHPLIQEVAYRSQLAASRRELHARVAAALEALHPERQEELASLAAHHWEEAEVPREAARSHLVAARHLSGIDTDAVRRHLLRARDWAGRVDDRHESARLRLRACLGLSAGSVSARPKGVDLEAIFEEGRALAVELGDIASHLALLVIRAIHAQRTGELELHEKLVDEIRRVAPPGEPRSQFVVAFQAAMSQARRGDLPAALAELDLAAKHHAAAVSLTAEPVGRSAYLGYFDLRAVVLMRLGRLDEAEATIDEGLEQAERHRAPASVMDLLASRVSLAAVRGDSAAALRAAEELTSGTRRIGGAVWDAVLATVQGGAHALAGRWTEAIEQLEQARQIVRESNLLIDAEGWIGIRLSEARLALGEPERAESEARAALAWAERGRHRALAIPARLALARARVARADGEGEQEVETLLEEAARGIEETGARVFAPALFEVRAALAAARGDPAARAAALREARKGYASMNATWHAKRIAAELRGAPRA